jgi:hypothetical protein
LQSARQSGNLGKEEVAGARLGHPGDLIGDARELFGESRSLGEGGPGIGVELLIEELELLGKLIGVSMFGEGGAGVVLAVVGRGLRCFVTPKDIVDELGEGRRLFGAIPEVPEDPEVGGPGLGAAADDGGGGNELEDLDGAAVGEGDSEVADLQDEGSVGGEDGEEVDVLNK